MSNTDTYRIRPAGRHILTIGRDLIQDSYAAVVELVKNAYDADSPDVNIEFNALPDKTGYILTITDHGHGMSRDTVINKWMVPSTDDKLKRQKSPAGRVMQGRKGIGRYAASILGTHLLLETVTPEGEKTTVYITWESFEKSQYLDDVEIAIETESVDIHQGTTLIITGNAELFDEWTQTQFDKLRFELKKLTSPVDTIDKNAEFVINLSISDFQSTRDISERIKPYPLVELFDYRISGKISKNGKGELIFFQQKARNTTEEKIIFDNVPTNCGDVVFDIRVYDREPDAISSLIARGLKDESGNYVGKRQARQLLNEYNGIGVYRNRFRIRPLGDPEFDWLGLNKRRVQNPSKCIGSDQAIGYVLIQSEEDSDLIEKSARDGLKDNHAYHYLKEITIRVISKLEEKRFSYRHMAGLGRSSKDIDKKIDKLFSSEKLKLDVKSSLEKSGIGKDQIENVISIIEKSEQEKNKVVEDIRQAVAVYQGQATLGKIINVILHEGRRPLNFFKNEIPNMQYWYNSFLKTGESEKLEKVMPVVSGIANNAEIFVKLFSRLDPLAAGKRSQRKLLFLKKTIQQTAEIFSSDLNKEQISVFIDGSDSFQLSGWYQDIYAMFTNLIDNSIYWISNNKKSISKEIRIKIATEDNKLLYIDYRDTGTGIEPSLIESEVIFEPEFSTKPDGTGLGLAIAGEAASRNALELKAFASDTGAYFRFQPKLENN